MMARLDRRTFLSATALATAGTLQLTPRILSGETSDTNQINYRDIFFRLCDRICRKYKVRDDSHDNKEKYFNYKIAYEVRGLAAAHDLSGKKEYLALCTDWADRMVAEQNEMIPRGAYYMKYGRRPGRNKGNWYVADGASIAMGVLATAVRCEEPSERKKYLDSVKSFFRLVADNWARPTGGIANGFWPKSDREYWCSTGTFGSLAFCLFKETGDRECLEIGRRAIDWLNRLNLFTIGGEHFPKKEIIPTVLFYCLEAYSAGLPHLKENSGRRRAAVSQLNKANRWILQDAEGAVENDYRTHRGSKRGGFPFHLYVSSAYLPGNKNLSEAADRQLSQMERIIENAPADDRIEADQLVDFVLLSLAERIAPGGIYRSSKGKTIRTG